ncbi:uncharacterized protein LOC120356293, partial [Nilaparvata lugens]|uniref:uncharacterized protein LOC120356293 n=1 Tax=Nilaparvata lugens TaxID=108931 RepID=UPI00193D5B50
MDHNHFSSRTRNNIVELAKTNALPEENESNLEQNWFDNISSLENVITQEKINGDCTHDEEIAEDVGLYTKRCDSDYQPPDVNTSSSVGINFSSTDVFLVNCFDDQDKSQEEYTELVP